MALIAKTNEGKTYGMFTDKERDIHQMMNTLGYGDGEYTVAKGHMMTDLKTTNPLDIIGHLAGDARGYEKTNPDFKARITTSGDQEPSAEAPQSWWIHIEIARKW